MLKYVPNIPLKFSLQRKWSGMFGIFWVFSILCTQKMQNIPLLFSIKKILKEYLEHTSTFPDSVNFGHPQHILTIFFSRHVVLVVDILHGCPFKRREVDKRQEREQGRWAEGRKGEHTTLTRWTNPTEEHLEGDWNVSIQVCKAIGNKNEHTWHASWLYDKESVSHRARKILAERTQIGHTNLRFIILM